MEKGEGSRSAAARPDGRSEYNNQHAPPLIFLSHSGRQKDFVTHLYSELHHIKYKPFFDKDRSDSLYPGRDYVPLILRACHGCKLAVVVLSDDYVKTLWPMLELQEFSLRNPETKIYPLFFQLKPSDLREEEKLKGWRHYWSEIAANQCRRRSKVEDLQSNKRDSSKSGDGQVELEMDKWEGLLKGLSDDYATEYDYIKAIVMRGEVRDDYATEYDYIKAIVSTICSELSPPSPLCWKSDAIKGVERMIQEEIIQLFDRQKLHNDNELGCPRDQLQTINIGVIGVYGIGGSGKTTLCQSLANFFTNEYCGKSWWLEFPSDDTAESQASLLAQINAILESMYSEDMAKLSTLPQALDALGKGLRENKVFLAVDNIWDIAVGGVQDARKIALEMVGVAESKVVVTGRSKEILRRVLDRRISQNQTLASEIDKFIVHVPSMSEAEAVEALISYSSVPFLVQPPRDKLTSLARSCFLDGYCHPLFVKAVGCEPKQLTENAWHSDNSWEDGISTLQTALDACIINVKGDAENAILEFLERSLEILTDKQKNILSDLVTCPEGGRGEGSVTFLQENCDWLAMVYGDDTLTASQIRRTILELEYCGFLEIVLRPKLYVSRFIRMHDLYKRLAERIANTRGVDAPFKHVFQGRFSSAPGPLAAPGELARCKYVHLRGPYNIEVNVQQFALAWRELMETRSSSRNLQVLVCIRSPSHYMVERDLAKYRLNAKCCLSGGHLKSLRVLRLEAIRHIEQLGGWEGVPNLVLLRLHNIESLQLVEAMGCLKKLEELEVSYCMRLQVQTLVHNNINSGAASCACESYCSGSNHEKVLRPATTSTWLVEAGDTLPNLRTLTFQFNGGKLVEVGPYLCSHSFPALETLDLSNCQGLTSISVDRHLGLSCSLRSLNLQRCEQLRCIEGSLSSLTALEELCLSYCSRLESITDLCKLRNLRILRAAGCNALNQVIKLNDSRAAVSCGLQRLNLWECEGSSMRVELPRTVFIIDGATITDQSTTSDSVEQPHLRSAYKPVASKRGAFSQLKDLYLGLPPTCTDHFTTLDLSAMPDLENLFLACFPKVREMHLQHAFKLADLHLHDFPSLEAINGLGTHHRGLSKINIHSCRCLKRISGLGLLPVVDTLWLENCDTLDILPSQETAEHVDSSECDAPPSTTSHDAVFRNSRPLLPISLETLHLEGCNAITDFTCLEHLTSLKFLRILNCPSMPAELPAELIHELKSLRRARVDNSGNNLSSRTSNFIYSSDANASVACQYTGDTENHDDLHTLLFDLFWGK